MPLQPARSDTEAAVGPEGGAAPVDVASRVARPGAGRSLPATVRASWKPRFGVGFGDVRIHDAPEDRTAARRIGARAFTWLRHIWLGPGELVEDRRLMAHELTHVTQQTPRQAAPAAARAAVEPEVRRASWIAEEAESYARDVPGYTLISVILGESPITGDHVPCTAENLIGGFLGLLPGGNRLFEAAQGIRAPSKTPSTGSRASLTSSTSPGRGYRASSTR